MQTELIQSPWLFYWWVTFELSRSYKAWTLLVEIDLRFSGASTASSFMLIRVQCPLSGRKTAWTFSGVRVVRGSSL